MLTNESIVEDSTQEQSILHMYLCRPRTNTQLLLGMGNIIYIDVIVYHDIDSPR